MAKRQSILRNAVDAVFAPSQYLTHDGAAYSTSKYVQTFNRVSKSPYLIYAGGIALEMTLGTPSSAFNYGLGAAIIAVVDKVDTTLPKRALLKDIFFDTHAQTRSFIDAPKASALEEKKRQGILDMVYWGVIGGAASGVSLASGGDTMLLPYFCALVSWGFGNYWRPKQVLDGNWTLLDKAPPEKQTSKASEQIPANAVPIRIHNCEMPPALEL